MLYKVKALHSFEAESPEELGFKHGDVIEVIREIDENWMEGTMKGRKGIFPKNHVV
jgi:hypothetical protein